MNDKPTDENSEILDQSPSWSIFRGKGVDGALLRARLWTVDVMRRSWNGDWEGVSSEQAQKNDASFKTDYPQIVSCFVTSVRDEIWVVTDFGRCHTDILLGDEYREYERKGDVFVGPPCS